MTNKETQINRLINDILSKKKLTITDRQDIAFLNEEIEAINYTHCCKLCGLTK